MIALIDAIVNFNVFIFPCNAGFWRIKPFDYFLIKIFKKKIIFISLGTDIRPPYLSGKFIKNNKISINSIYNRTKKVIKKIKQIESYADHIISYPAHSQLLKKKFINGLLIGNPIDIELLKEKNTIECENQNNISKINILHAPSDPLGKGTAKIREIIEDLKKKGYEINYVEITNQPHYKVIEAIKNCDFVIDQIYSDTPFPFFSIEAGLLSKPSVIGGYYKDFLKNDIKDSEFPDFLFVNPENLLSICEDLCKSKELRIEYGKKIQKFLIENWSYTEVCKKYIKIMEGDFPAIWWYDPENISYFYGYGINKDELKEFLRKYISTFGEKSLFLEHNKNLLDKINNINSVK